MTKENLEITNNSPVKKAKEFPEKNVIFNEDGSVTSPKVTLWNPHEALRYFDEQKKLVLERIREESEPVIKEISDLLLKSWEFDKQRLDECEVKFLVDFMQKYGIWKTSKFISDLVEYFPTYISPWNTTRFYEQINLTAEEWSAIKDNNHKFDLIKEYILKWYGTREFLDSVQESLKDSNKKLYEEEKNKFYGKLVEERKTAVERHLVI